MAAPPPLDTWLVSATGNICRLTTTLDVIEVESHRDGKQIRIVANGHDVTVVLPVACAHQLGRALLADRPDASAAVAETAR